DVRAADYVQPIEQTRRIYGNTRSSVDIQNVDNRVVNRGLDPGFVERRGNIRLDRVDVVENRRGSGERITRDQHGERVEMYKPHLDAVPTDRLFRRQDGQRSRDDRQNQDNQKVQTQQPPRWDRQQHVVPPAEGDNQRGQWQRQSQQRFDVPRQNDR